MPAVRREKELGMITGIETRTNGVPGLLKVICPTNKDATNFQCRISADGGQTWPWKESSHTRTVEMPGLPIDTRFMIQVRMKNGYGLGPWSNVFVARIPSNEDVVIREA